MLLYLFTPVIVIASCDSVFVLTDAGPTISLLLLFFLLLSELSLHEPLHGGLSRPLPAPVKSSAGTHATAAGQARLRGLFIQMLKYFSPFELHNII